MKEKERNELKLGFKSIFRNKDNRNLFQNIFFAFLIKGFSLIISMFSMPLYIRYFDNDTALGLWYTLLSLLSWVLICDLGLGNGLRNKLTEALAVKDNTRCRKLISSTYLILSALVFPILIAGVLCISVFSLNSFFNIPASIVSEAALTKSLIILFVGICISFVLKVINSVAYAIQKASINNFITLVSSILPLIYVLLFNGNDVNHNLVALSYVHIIAVNLPLIVATVVLFSSRSLCDIKPSFRFFDKGMARQMLTLGVEFFISQILFMALTHTNEIIISKVYSASDVVTYNIYFKLFTMIGSLFMLALTPIWSKVTKDLAEKKYDTIIKTNKILLLISVMATVSEFVMIIFLQWGINLWLGDAAISVDYSSAVIFACYGSAYILNIVLTTIANGIGALKTQIVFYGIGAVLKIPAILIMKSLNLGWPCVMLYNAVVLLVFCLFQYIWVKKYLNKLKTN